MMGFTIIRRILMGMKKVFSIMIKLFLDHIKI